MKFELMSLTFIMVSFPVPIHEMLWAPKYDSNIGMQIRCSVEHNFQEENQESTHLMVPSLVLDLATESFPHHPETPFTYSQIKH